VSDFFRVPTSEGLLTLRQYDNSTFQAIGGDSPSTPTPEPGSLLLLGSGIAGILLRRFRR